MDCQNTLVRLGQVLKPHLESAIGPVPKIEFRPVQASAWMRDMGVHPDRERRMWFIRYDPELVEYYLRRRRGELWHVVTHEIVHLVNVEARRRVLARPWDSIPTPMTSQEVNRNDRWEQFTHSIEGGAELAALATNLNLIRSGKVRQLMAEAYRVKPREALQDQLEYFMSWALAQLVVALKRSGHSNLPDISSLNLPFGVGPLRRSFECQLKKAADAPQRAHSAFMPYALGVSRCGRLMRRRNVSLPYLLRNPIPNRELHQLTR